jgi:DNA-binding NarL/FixJ family response regulator
LIITDRLTERAKVLADYLRTMESFHVIGLAENEQQALQLAEHNTLDYLIIAGYLKVEQTYRVIAELQKRNKKLLPVQWAMLDTLIASFCYRYQIPLKFERTLPMADFARFLNEHKNDRH